MVIKRGVLRLKPRQMGIALENITEGSFGSALFEKEPGSGQYFEFEVKAVEYVREHHEIWVVDSNNGVTEHTPQELRSEDTEGIPYRVKDDHPLPVTQRLKTGHKIWEQGVTAAGTITSLISSTGMYVVLHSVVVTSPTVGDEIYLEAMDSDGTWRVVCRWDMNAQAIPTQFNGVKLDKFYSSGVEYSGKAGDGTNARVRFTSVGTGPFYVTVVWSEEK